MNISGIPSNAMPADTGLQTNLAKRYQDFTALHNALQAGNVSTAQSAFAAFLQEVQTTAHKAGPNSLFAPGSQPSKDLDAIGSALKADDMAGAQKAFSVLTQDIQSAWQPVSGDPIAVAPPHHHLQLGGHNAGAFEANASGASKTQTLGKILNLQA